MGIRKRTTEEFKQAILEKYNGKIEILSEYNGGSSPIDFVYHCEKHGDIFSTINAKNISSNKALQPCKECAREVRNKKNMTNSELLEELKEKATSYDGFLLDTQWVNCSHKYKFKCSNPEHPVFEMSCSAIMGRKQCWCPYCSGRYGNFNDEIESIIKSRDGVLLTEYSGSYNHVRVKCNKDNYEWDILPSNLKKGQWCYVCRMPKSERIVYDLLVKTKFIIRAQYRFKDLVSENNHELRFDFALIENGELKTLIEIDDNEHRCNYSGDSERGRRRLKAKERDVQKIKYCSDKGIDLLKIQINKYSDTFKDDEKYERFIKEEITKHLGSVW